MNDTDLLDLLLAQDPSPGTAPADRGITPRPPGEAPPMSRSQQRLWFIHHAAPHSAAYHIASAVHIAGPLNVDALRHAVAELARRHESLRSGFESVDGQPQVKVLGVHEVEVRVEVIDLSGEHEAATPAQLAARCAGYANQPFDLAAPPLLRAWLLRLGPQEHVALLVMHHIVADGGSVGLLIEEMGQLYAAFAAGRPAPLAPPVLQYGDFAAWQARWLVGDAAAEQRQWWTERLAGLTPLALPTDRPRPDQPSHRGGTCAWRVSAATTASLRQIGRREGATPFMTMLAAFAVLLARHAGQHDIAVGAPVAQRNRRELEPLVGMLVNTLVLRCDLSGRPGFAAVLRRVRDFTSEALARQDLPFEDVVRAVAPQRDGRSNPLFQVAFTMESVANEPLALPGLALSRLDLETGTAKFDLLLNVGTVGAELHGAFEYDSDLFDASTVARMAGHFTTLLAAIAADPQHDITTLPLLTSDELAQLARWNETTREYPHTRTIAQCFARQADATPEAIALDFDDAVLSYRALDARAERLAARLHAAGVQSGMPVALHAPRSAAMVVAMLAILKAGGAYVPLDPAYPRERLHAMLADCGARVLLAPPDLAAALGPCEGVSVLGLADEPDVAVAPMAPVGVNGESLAYVIYTSGSTGVPKGVAVPQRAVLRLVLNTNYVSLGASDRIAQASNTSFDAATFEIWGALLNGARLVGATADVLLSPPRLAAWLRDQGITTLWLTSSLFNQIAREVPTAFATLRDLLVGGEPLNAQCLREVLHAGPPLRLLNGYGPTENTTFSTWKWVREVAPEATTVPIGQPVANTQAYVLDGHQQLVPVGVVGELYLGGDGLALGYLGRPQETAERFVPNPLDHGRTRLYRSGDIVRRRADGDIEFIGRRDNQVKIRGFRVELGEIEAALARHPAVREAVVLARQDRPGPRELVAYLVARGSERLDLAALREALAQSLPAHMLPARWVVLPALPLNENGKADRQALPIPADEPATDDRERAAPQGTREQCIAEVWRQVLGRSHIARDDNWFELGGDSITAIQVVSRLRRAGWRVRVADLFRHPTVAGLAPRLEDDTPEAEPAETAPGTPIPLTPVQGWFFEQHRGGRLAHFNQAVLLALAEPLDEAVLRAALAALLQQHDALRLRFDLAADGTVRQTCAAPGEAPVLDTQHLRGNAAWAPALEAHADQVQRGLDIAHGPLMRAARYHLDDGDRLLLVIHHLAVDAVSWRILLEDLQAALRQAAAGAPVALGSPSWPWGRWARRMAALQAGPDLLAEDAYWIPVEDAESGRLPTHPDAPARLRHGDVRSLSLVLPAADTARLLTRSHRLFETGIMELMLVALGRALAQWCDTTATRITLEGHGREPPDAAADVSHTVGWFTSLYPFMLRVDGDDIGAQVTRMKEALAAVPRKGIGHGLLRHGPRPRAVPATHRPQLAFNYLGRFGDDEGADAAPLLRLTGGPTGRAVDPYLPRAHAIDITALVSEGRLQATIDHDPTTLDEAAATRLRDAFAEQLVAVGRHCHERLERLEALCTASGGEVVDAYPLAPLQEGMLFQSLLEPGAAIYQVQVRFRFTGPFDLVAFKGAWADLCRRHAVLSSVFVHEDLPRPMQVVLRGRDPAFHVGTLDSLAAYCADDRQRGFDLHLGPLMRMAVFRERDDLHHVVWTYHHILLDGWCLALLQRDFAELYAARVAARPAQLPPPAPYKDYIRWLGRQDREAARQHWRAHLAGYEQPASLPRRASRDAGAARRLEECLLELDEATSARLVRTAASLGATLNTMVQTLWALVLARHGDRDDVVFGIVVSGRPAELPGVEQMVGLFIGAVPVRVSLPPDAAFDAVVRQVQASALAAEPHRHLSLADIQAESPLGRALFDHLLIFENYPLAAAGSTPSDTANEPRLEPRLEPVEAHDPTHYDLDLTVVPGARIACRFMFDANVYPPDLIDRVALQLRTAIEAVLDDPTQPIRHVEILPAEERALVLQHFNATDRDYPRDTTFIDLFEAQAARTPLAAAVRHGNTAMTYRELDHAASRLAGHLRRLGVGAEVAVGVCVDRCADMIVAPLAVMKAGGVFVPLDPDYPRQRLAFMVADAGIRVLVTRSLVAERLDALGDDTVVVRMDAFDPLADTAPAPRPAPADTAYLIYTSGSTGQPKGVRVSHANLASAVFAWQHAYHLADQPVRLLQMASCSFDVFMGDLVRALAHGGSLVVCPPDALPDPAALHALLLRHEITLFEATPAVVLPLMDHVHRHGLPLPALRLLVVGSDLLPAAHFRTLWHRFGRWLRVVNSYGASEATIDTSFFEMSDPAALDAVGPNTPIGRPLPNTRCYVLDRLGRPQPIGAPGELYIGGAGVAQGYLNRPALTEARFLACDAAGGARVYRTGDVARWLPDGNLDFMGRRDAQVKVRGYRIELGEIEDRLLRCPSVAQAVVLARDAGQGPELVAYIVAAAGWDVGETRGLLREALPGYMVPAFFVRLDSLPLSPNGKVDRRALPDPRATAERTKAYEPPEGEVERAIAAVWQRVLQVPQVGRHDDFFELGGHSLKALQITAQVHQALGVPVALRHFFEEPTVAALARRVHATEAHARTALADIVPAPALPHHALSHAQRRLWMLDQLGGGAAYNMPEAHLIHADVDTRALGAALGALIARHESLRTAFIVVDGEPRQQVRTAAPLTLAEHDLRDEPPAVAQARARELADRDANQPFNLGEPPLVRASLARMPGGHCLFVLTLHHIVGDGWSCNLLMRELLALYDALRRGLPDPLPPLRIQYKDFAHWQNAQGFDTQERYWLGQLAGMPAQVSLPYDFAAEEARSFTGSHTQLTLDRQVADGLRQLARARRTTLANVMLALLHLLLFHWTRQGDLCVGMSVANRSHPDVERLIGFFVNLLPIRCRLDDEMEFDDLLTQVIERTGEALEHQDYPFDRMVEKLNPERRANRQPLVNVVYGFQNFLDVHTGDAPPSPAEAMQTQAAPVGWSSFDISFAKSKFDLTLFVVEEQDDIVLTLEYDSALFLDTTLRTQLDHFAGFAAALAGATPSPGSTQ